MSLRGVSSSVIARSEATKQSHITNKSVGQASRLSTKNVEGSTHRTRKDHYYDRNS